MRKVPLALIVPVMLAVAALAVVAAGDRRGRVSGLAVSPLAVATSMKPGEEACQRPIRVTQRFGQVRFRVGTAGRPGPELVVAIRDVDSGSSIRSGRLAAGYPDNSEPVVFVGDVPPGRRIAVCIRNIGDRAVALIGSSGDLVPGTKLYLEGRPGNGDLTISFYAAHRPSALDEVPEIFRRAALFRPAVVGTWTFWVLAVLLVVGVPLLLLGALQSSLEDDA